MRTILAQRLCLSKKILDEIIRHCKKTAPNEACGILAGKGNVISKIYEMTNIEKSPESYFMDSKEQFSVMKEIREHELDIVCIYHSHPKSSAYPSRKDKTLAVYEEPVYMIISLAEKDAAIRVFSIKRKKVAEVEIFIKK
ncbi:MAG: M67 family metallopeptidase [Nitrospiraceae bacterium]|nr:M67 family metallopeptidase [Nitrospiraceae bacterium]